MRPEAEETAQPDEHPFAAYVRTLGRGPGRSRALTREEARTALAMILRGEADPHQVGALLMLLRYRGEDAEEIVGLVEAARGAVAAGPPPPGIPPIDLDWPSYGAGRTRAAPWYLLAALALAGAGYRVVMHGTNEFSGGMSVPVALAALGLRPAADRREALEFVARMGFAYLPLTAMSPELARLLALRRLLGLRSPLNTVARLLDPFDARAGVDGVFHPPYITLHLSAARLLALPRLLVLKGGGGEAERNPAKSIEAYLHERGDEPRKLTLPAIAGTKPKTGGADLLQVWRGETGCSPETARVVATVAMAILAIGAAATPEDADHLAAGIWQSRALARIA